MTPPRGYAQAMPDRADLVPVAAPVTAPQWLVVALTEHLAATEQGGGHRRGHLEAARAAYQQVLDLYDAHCLPAAVRGLEALARQEAGHPPAGLGVAMEVSGRRVRPFPARTSAPRGGVAISGDAPAAGS